MPRFVHGNAQIHYDVFGEGKPLVFIPGIGVGGNIWMPVIEKTAERFQCITIDTRGAGFSNVPRGPYSMADIAEDVAALCRSLDIENPVVAGHSMGGFAALTLLVTVAFPVAGLVLVATGATGAVIRDDFMSAVPGETRNDVVDRIVRHGVGSCASSEMKERLRSLILSRPLRGMGYLSQRAAVTTFDITGDLSRVTVPCCIVHGTDDAVIPIETARAVAEEMDRSTFLPLLGVGHFPIVEAPDATADAVMELASTAFSP